MRAMKQIIALVFLCVAAVGCQSVSKVTTTEIKFRVGTNELTVSNPKDTSWEDLMISPNDGVVRIKKYRSSANEAAISAAERQAEAQVQMFNGLKEQFERGAEIAARMYGVPIPPRQPVAVSTNSVAK